MTYQEVLGLVRQIKNIQDILDLHYLLQLHAFNQTLPSLH